VAGAPLPDPHFRHRTQDQDALAHLSYEPLAGFDPDGNVGPILATEVPSVSAGTLSKAHVGTWRLSVGVTGTTAASHADDVRFTWESGRDPASIAAPSARFREIAKIETPDPYPVKLGFTKPHPAAGPTPFCASAAGSCPSTTSTITAAPRPAAPSEPQPVAPGPSASSTSSPGDCGCAPRSPDLPLPNRRLRRHVEMKGRRRLVFRRPSRAPRTSSRTTREHASRRLLCGSSSQSGPGQHLCHRQRRSHPAQHHRPVDRSTVSARAPRPHRPLLSDPAVRQALSLLVDRSACRRKLGRQGRPARPTQRAARVRSSSLRWRSNVRRALRS